MSTKGNLELRLGEEALFGSTTHDGQDVYKIIPRFAWFLDETSEAGHEDYKNWFRKTSKEIIPFRTREGLLGGAYIREVIIDVERKLILWTADENSFELFEDYHPGQFRDAIKSLRQDHGYQIMQYDDCADIKERALSELRKEHNLPPDADPKDVPPTIIKLSHFGDDFYMEWSALTREPQTDAMSLDQFKDYYRKQYGEAGMEQLPERLKRVHENGCSSHVFTLTNILSNNRAGPNETSLSKEGIIKKYCLK